ncbi:MAG: CAP domain-containing protein [Parcubacteria group bacterium]|jgi:uncharacterized protein YkwD
MKQNAQKLNKYVLIIISLGWALVFVSSVQASEISPENVIKYVNEAREKEGLLDLNVSEKLTQVATDKVNDMVAHHYFAHTSPAGLNPWHWFELEGYDYKYAGENLAINFTTAEAEQAAWMKSPTHRKNILNVNYQEIGVAVAAGEVNGTMGIIAVQEFGTLAHPGAGSEKKDFAPVKDKAIPVDTKFVPTVLSTGDQKIDENLKRVGEEIVGQKNNLPSAGATSDFFWLVMFVVIILPIALVNVVFVGRLIGIPWLKEILQRSYSTARANNPQAYFRKLKVKNYEKYRIIKVRIITT